MTKYLTCFCLLLPVYAFGQKTDSLSAETPHPDIIREWQTAGPQAGQVILHSEKQVENLLQWHIQLNKKRKAFTGYRIQILSTSSYGSDIEKLKEMRDQFETAFPDIPAYLNYFDPDFKIRAGNFHSRLECIPALHRIRKLYPSSYPVKTEIKLEELKRIPMQDIPKTEEKEADRQTDQHGTLSGNSTPKGKT